MAHFTPVMSGGDGEEYGNEILVESSGDFYKIIFCTFLLPQEKVTKLILFLMCREIILKLGFNTYYHFIVWDLG